MPRQFIHSETLYHVATVNGYGSRSTWQIVHEFNFPPTDADIARITREAEAKFKSRPWPGPTLNSIVVRGAAPPLRSATELPVPPAPPTSGTSTIGLPKASLGAGGNPNTNIGAGGTGGGTQVAHAAGAGGGNVRWQITIDIETSVDSTD